LTYTVNGRTGWTDFGHWRSGTMPRTGHKVQFKGLRGIRRT
jgi:hypothetical protein